MSGPGDFPVTGDCGRVHLTLPDGTDVDLEVRDEGIQDGVRRYVAAAPPEFVGQLLTGQVRMHAQVLPAGSSLAVVCQ